jgi:cyclopropane-fatty-acyl-phospholipid synthase
MNPLTTAFQSRLAALTVPVALQLPDGSRLGAASPRVALTLREWSPLAHLAAGAIGRIAEDHVEGRIEFDGAMRDLVEVAAQLMVDDPTQPAGPLAHGGPLQWWLDLRQRGRSMAQHTPEADARQVEFHYDVSDDFYALWLDPLRVYSCAYFREPGMTLAEAQQAKLDHICRKLRLQPGERFLDIGAGWGALLLRAAEHYGVQAHGITLSKHQHAHVQRLIDERGLGGRVSVELCDYRELPEDRPWHKIASVGMFEHVGRARLPAYFGKIRRLLAPGGLLMNHGITAGGTRNDRLGAGIGEFMERHIFPGGELVHVSRALHELADAGLEPLDVESLRPHYARTLWAWSDALEARLAEARAVADERTLRAYRLYLAGSAMSFERGWISLFQMLAARPSGDLADGTLRGAQSSYPFNREYQYR